MTRIYYFFVFCILKNKDRKLVYTFNYRFRHTHDCLSLNNTRFGSFLHLIYPNEYITLLTLNSLYLILNIHLAIDNTERLKQNTMTNVMTSLFQ